MKEIIQNLTVPLTNILFYQILATLIPEKCMGEERAPFRVIKVFGLLRMVHQDSEIVKMMNEMRLR